MKYDSEEKGLLTIFKPYQLEAMELLWEGNEYNTRTVWQIVEKKLPRKGEKETISRASIIIFVQKMAEESYLTYRETTGKGGYHKVYSSPYTKQEFLKAW